MTEQNYYNTRASSRGKLPIGNGEVDSRIVEMVCLLTMMLIILAGVLVITTNDNVPVCDAEDYPTVVPCDIPGGTHRIMEIPPQD